MYVCVCVQSLQCNRLREKLVFVTSVASVILMAYALVVVQWLLPYYYAITAPLLIGLRVCLYMYVCMSLCVALCSLYAYVSCVCVCVCVYALCVLQHIQLVSLVCILLV